VTDSVPFSDQSTGTPAPEPAEPVEPAEPGAPGAPVTAATLICWNCRTVNSAARTVCRSCGQRLRRIPAATAPGATPPRPPLPSRWILAGALLLALVILAAAISLNPGRGTPPPEVASRISSPTAAPGTPTRTPTTTVGPAVLPVATALASSVWNQDADHAATRVLDDDPGTAWISGRGRPAGESVILELARDAVVTEIGIANGYQRPGHFAGNGRAARVLISFDDGSAAERTLQDRPGLQVFQLAGRMSPAPSPTRSVLIQVRSVRPPGAANVAISTVVLRGRLR
jgi:hypothetical protein